MFEAVLDDIPPIRMPSGRRPGKLHADKAYDHRRCRRHLRRRGIRPRIARRLIESSERLGRHRWTIERTGAWLGGFRRLRIRYERGSERFYALAMLACSVICDGNACSRHVVREAGTGRPSGRRGMASVSSLSRVSSCRPEAGRRHQACWRAGAEFHLKGRYRGWISCRGGCGGWYEVPLLDRYAHA
jgi:transposase